MPTREDSPRTLAARGCAVAGSDQAYLQMTRECFGDAWITPAHLRIGASPLYDELIPLLA